MNKKPAPQKNEMDHLSKDEQWVKEQLQHHMDSEVDQLDFNVSSKLAAARHRALDQNASESTATGWLNWKALAGSTAVLALALVIGNRLQSPDAITADPSSVAVTAPANTTTVLAQSTLIEDLPLLAASDDLEFYQSIEFLEWLDRNSG